MLKVDFESEDETNDRVQLVAFAKICACEVKFLERECYLNEKRVSSENWSFSFVEILLPSYQHLDPVKKSEPSEIERINRFRLVFGILWEIRAINPANVFWTWNGKVTQIPFEFKICSERLVQTTETTCVVFLWKN